MDSGGHGGSVDSESHGGSGDSRGHGRSASMALALGPATMAMGIWPPKKKLSGIFRSLKTWTESGGSSAGAGSGGHSGGVGTQEERALEGAVEEQSWLTWGTQEMEGWTGPAEVKEAKETQETMEGWTEPAETKEDWSLDLCPSLGQTGKL